MTIPLRIDFAMLRYTMVFTRILVLVWLATWVLADPLSLLQELMAPQEHSAGHSFIRNGTGGKHFAQHYSDVRISSSTESNSNRSEETQSDESGSASRVDLRRFDRAQSVMLTVAFQPWFPFFPSAAPRAPPSASLGDNGSVFSLTRVLFWPGHQCASFSQGVHLEHGH